jgi:hypothetical protein
MENWKLPPIPAEMIVWQVGELVRVDKLTGLQVGEINGGKQ